jgi:uncharacterized protein
VNAGNAKGTIVVAGNPRLVAGSTLEAQDFGEPDGKYLIQTARHKITRGKGYDVDIEVTRA